MLRQQTSAAKVASLWRAPVPPQYVTPQFAYAPPDPFRAASPQQFRAPFPPQYTQLQYQPMVEAYYPSVGYVHPQQQPLQQPSVLPVVGHPQEPVQPPQPPTPQLPEVLTPDQAQQMQDELRKLREEVDSLRERVPSGDELAKRVTAGRWLLVDSKRYDQLLVINFEVLNKAYKAVIKASIPNINEEDLQFPWSTLRQMAEQIVWDPSSVVRRGAPPSGAADLKFSGRRPHTSSSRSGASDQPDFSPGGPFDVLDDWGEAEFGDTGGDARQQPSFPPPPFAPPTSSAPPLSSGKPTVDQQQRPISPTRLVVAVDEAAQSVYRPGPSRIEETEITLVARSLGANRRPVVPPEVPPATTATEDPPR